MGDLVQPTVMKTLDKFTLLLYAILSILVFVFFVPMPESLVIKIVAGYVFYLFVKEIWLAARWERAKTKSALGFTAGGARRARLSSNVRHANHLHHEEKKNKRDIRSYL